MAAWSALITTVPAPVIVNVDPLMVPGPLPTENVIALPLAPPVALNATVVGEPYVMGLSIASHIVSEHQGVIGVTSEVGAGTVVEVKIPIATSLA